MRQKALLQLLAVSVIVLIYLFRFEIYNQQDATLHQVTESHAPLPTPGRDNLIDKSSPVVVNIAVGTTDHQNQNDIGVEKSLYISENTIQIEDQEKQGDKQEDEQEDEQEDYEYYEFHDIFQKNNNRQKSRVGDDEEEEEYEEIRVLEFRTIPPVTSKNSITVNVELPKALPRCVPSFIFFTPTTGKDHRAVFETDVIVQCLVVSENPTEPISIYERTLPVMPNMKLEILKRYPPAGMQPKRNSAPYVAYFFPDDSTRQCKVTVQSKSAKLQGDVERIYEVGDIPPTRPYCWSCEGTFKAKAPLPHFFALADDEKNILWEKESSTIELHNGEHKRFWIIPLHNAPHLSTSSPSIEKVPRYSGEAYENALFNGWLESENITVAANISNVYDHDAGGYQVDLVGLEPGVYDFNIILNFVYPNTEVRKQPEPILFGIHIRHETSLCDEERMQIANVDILKVKVSGSNMKYPRQNRKCGKWGDSLPSGRWIRVPLHEKCRAPFCSGDRVGSMVSSMSWQGNIDDSLWVPYDCHYHLFNEKDISTCTKELNIRWIHIMGDSIAREFAAYLMSMFIVPDTEKFDHADVMITPELRITFLGWQDILLNGIITQEKDDHMRPIAFTEQILEHFNLLRDSNSSVIEDGMLHLNLPRVETESPDVFVMGPASAYCLYLQSEKAYEQYAKEFSKLVKERFEHDKNAKVQRGYWYSSPYIHGTAHAGTEYLTQGRNERFNRLARKHVEPAGFKFIDFANMTKCRPFESWDGLHYLRGYEEWTGHVAASFIQIWLNDLFAECSVMNNK